MRYLILPTLLLFCQANTALASNAEHAGHDRHGHEDQHEYRQHGAHEHGSATMRVAVDGNTLIVEFETPAANLIGFEHHPKSNEERTKVSDTAALLKQPAALLTLPTSADCRLSRISVESVLLYSDESSSHVNTDDHADFDIGYEFQCSVPARLDALSVKAFEHFPNLQNINAQWLTPNSQSTKRLTSDDSNIPLQ